MLFVLERRDDDIYRGTQENIMFQKQADFGHEGVLCQQILLTCRCANEGLHAHFVCKFTVDSSLKQNIYLQLSLISLVNLQNA